jgi:hypothetical protein
VTTVTRPGAPRPRRVTVWPGHGQGVAGVFAGMDGIELCLHHAGHQSVLLNEIEPHVQVVPHAQSPDIELTGFLERLKTMERRSAG